MASPRLFFQESKERKEVIETKEVKNPNQEKYEAMVEEYKKTAEGSALWRHIARCLDDKGVFSTETIKALLDKMHSPGSTGFKARLIALFNASHYKCKWALSAQVTQSQSLSQMLHLGTMRVWNEDGSVNEEQFEKLINHTVEKDEARITKSKLLSYLKECAKADPEEEKTGRNVSGGRGSKGFQETAAPAAWGQVFDTCTSSWKQVGEVWEPCISVEDIKLFYYDSPLLYMKSECHLLPAVKPEEPCQNKSWCLVA